MILDRRRFLAALGLGGASLLLPSAPRGVARAAEDAIPKRLVLIGSTHGTWHPGWKMRAGALPDDAVWSFPLADLPEASWSEALQPLYPHHRRLVMLEGLSMASMALDTAQAQHEMGNIHAWTGDIVRQSESGVIGTGPSIDQLVARAIARSDRLASVELAVMGAALQPIARGPSGLSLPRAFMPNEAFQRVFGSRNTDPREIRARTSVLDFARAEYAALAPRLDATDRARLDQHFELVRQLELRTEGMANLSCAVEEPQEQATDPVGRYRSDARAFSELTATMLGCDVTRVVSLSLSDAPAEAFGFPTADVHDAYAHRVYADPNAAAAMTAHNRYQATIVAELLDLLEAIPEGDGTLLDHTLVVWANELGDGPHGTHRYNVVLAGGGWHFGAGRYHHWPLDLPILSTTGWLPEERMGRPHQHLLVSIARAMGLELDSVGQTDLQSNLTGDWFDLRGELEELRA